MKNETQPLISICIPTYQRPEIIKNTILSIIEENISSEILDVCITDNSITDETKEMIEQNFNDREGIYYKKVKCEGFYNSIEALKFGNGKFLKLHNDYSKFKPGELKNIINIIKQYQEESPVIFFSLGALKKKRVERYYDFNEFLYNIHYYSTYSSSFGIWKKDFWELYKSGIYIDRMFPHTSFLFNMTKKDIYIVDDNEYVDNLTLRKKGGYNLPNAFIRLYLTMVKSLKKTQSITQITYKKIEFGIIRFVAFWFNNVKFNSKIYYFTFENTEEIIKETCGDKAVKIYKAWKTLYYIKFLIKFYKNKILLFFVGF